jgi:hypothetical protein
MGSVDLPRMRGVHIGCSSWVPASRQPYYFYTVLDVAFIVQNSDAVQGCSANFLRVDDLIWPVPTGKPKLTRGFPGGHSHDPIAFVFTPICKNMQAARRLEGAEYWLRLVRET